MGYLVRLASIIGAAALFAGCGGSQQIGQTASPQLQGDATSTPLPGAVAQRASRPLPRYPQSSQPLLYVADDDHPFSVDVFFRSQGRISSRSARSPRAPTTRGD